MATSCEHLQGLASKDCPPQKTPNACEECLSEGTVWVALRECQRAATWVAATLRLASMQPNTFTRRSIRSCARCRRRLGLGAMFMRRSPVSAELDCPALSRVTFLGERLWTKRFSF
jgi:hypothetical protein